MLTYLLAVAVVFSGLALIPLPVEAAPGTPHAVACQALLSAVGAVPGSEKTNPLASIRDLQFHLRRTPGLSPGFDPRQMDGYGDIHFVGTLVNPADSPERAAEVLAHLAQLEDHSISTSSQISRVGVELRGEKAVQEFLQSLRGELSQLDKLVGGELERRFPFWRMGKILPGLAYSLLWAGGVFGLVSAPDDWVRVPALVAALAALSVHMKISMVPQQNLQSGLGPQLELADTCGFEGCANGTVSLVSGHLQVPQSFHRELMVGKPGLDSTVIQSEPSRRTRWDNILNWLLALPDSIHTSAFNGEPTRHLLYDSLFYVDPVSHETVWLIYYRAFNETPVRRKPQRRDEPLEQYVVPSPIYPGMVAVPVRQ